MFELNLATLPNHILYLEGVQLSYIKVFVQIFNFWHSQKPCYLSNKQLIERTGLHRTTIIDAISFFEQQNVLKRVQKGSKRYLVQTAKVVECENEPVDNSAKNSLNNAQESELGYGGVGDRLRGGSELGYTYNNKYNNKDNKSFCLSDEQKKSTPVDNIKEQNKIKHSWADKSKQKAVDVTKLSNCYKATPKAPPNPDSEGYKAFKKVSAILQKSAPALISFKDESRLNNLRELNQCQ